MKNGDFESGVSGKIPKYWGTEYYNSYIVPGRKGKAVQIINKIPLMSLGAQEVKLDWRKVPIVSLSAWVKLDNVVPGVEEWNRANIQVLFFDAKGEQLGGWPEIGKWEGTFDWTKFGRNFYVPRGTVRAKVVFGLFNCSGEAHFDDIVLAPLPDQSKTDPHNLVRNGGFEVWEHWAYGGSKDWGIEYNGAREGNGALRIKNAAPVWSFASQSVFIDGRKYNKLKLSGYVKAKDVEPGVRPWQLARINIEFKDSKGKRIGGWPILDAFSGTFDWRHVEKTYDIPPETRRVDLYAGLLECRGEAWFDGIRMTASDAAGNLARPGGTTVTDTKGWYQFRASPVVPEKTPTDVSFLLDAPAGKHGFVTAKDGRFYFENGKRVRFWGTNIYAPSTFPTKKDAEIMAERLSRAGCNAVRIHHLDAFWANPNIFDQNFNDTQHFNAEALNKMDYLIYQLKKRGIYVFMDLLVDREFKEGDGVADYQNVGRGAKFAGFFDDRIIELQKKYARQLMTHVNPYTGLRYADDPAIMSVMIINEAMLFYIGTQFNLSEHYVGKFDAMFNEWLVKKYGGRGGLERGWTDQYGRRDLMPDEDPRRGTVKRADIPLKYQRSGGEKREPLRLADTLKFYEEVQNRYFSDMAAYLRGLGVRVPLSGSNHWVNVYADVKSNATLDLIDRHRYWDHPQLSYGTKVVFENQSMLKSPEDALPNNFAFYRVEGKPFVITEWNCSFPNEFRVEGPLVIAAYANLQDWDGVLQFSFNNAGWEAPMEDNFDISAWPNVFSQWPAASLLFHRGDVAPAKGVVNWPVPERELYGPINEDDPIAGDPYLPYLTKTKINFSGKEEGSARDIASRFHDRNRKRLSSDTGELMLDYGVGMFTINTDKTQAVIGFTEGRRVELKDYAVRPGTPFSSIAVTSLDGRPISGSKKLLLTAAARIENKGQKYNESKTQLENVGTSPIIAEGVSASFSFRRPVRSVRALDINGKPLKSIATQGGNFRINRDDRAFFYEITL